MKEKLRFDKKKHKYYLGEQELISVTTFLKMLFPFDASALAKRIAKHRRDNGEKVTAWDVKREWKAIADAGTLTHAEIEMWLLDMEGTETIKEVFTEKAKQGIKWVSEFLERIPNPTLSPEIKIYDKELGLAGTIDLMVKHDDKGEEVITLIDWKTNNSLTKSYGNCKHETINHMKNNNLTKYTLQLSIYAYMLERQGNTIKELIIPHLLDDQVIVYKVPYLRREVKELLFERADKHF